MYVWVTIDRLQVTEYRHLLETRRLKLKVDLRNQGEEEEGRMGERRQRDGSNEEGRKVNGEG